MSEQDISDRLDTAVYKAGLTPEQAGDNSIAFDVERDHITLYFDGDQVELDDVDQALAKIDAWGKARKKPWHPGAIIAFVKKVEKLLSEATSPKKFLDKVDAISAACELESLGAEPDGLTAQLEGQVLGYYKDANELVWCVFVDSDKDVQYVLAEEKDEA